MPKPDYSAMRAPVPGMPGIDVFRARYRNHQFARHAHETLAIGVVDGGIGEFWCRGENHRVGRNSLVLIGPEEIHTGRSLDPDRPLCYRMMYVDVRECQLLLGQRVALSFRSAAPLDERAASRFRTTFDRLLPMSPSSKFARQSALVGLLDMLLEGHGQRSGLSATSRCSRLTAADQARKLLQDHFSEHYSLSQLAAAVGVNAAYLIRAFSARFGIPPHAYQTYLRVMRGADLLRQGASISRTALELGFADQSHFNRNFKRILGVSPGQYRGAFRGTSGQ